MYAEGEEPIEHDQPGHEQPHVEFRVALDQPREPATGLPRKIGLAKMGHPHVVAEEEPDREIIRQTGFKPREWFLMARIRHLWGEPQAATGWLNA